MVLSWFLLVCAGLLEVCWAVGLKRTESFTRPLPTLLTVSAMIASFYLLSVALRTIPIGTAYGVWVGIGAAGAAIFGMVFLGEPASAARIAFVGLLVASIVGLKLTSP